MTENNMTLPEHTFEYLNIPKGKPVLLTLLYCFKHLIKSYLKQYLNRRFQYPQLLARIIARHKNISTYQITELERYTERNTNMTCDREFQLFLWFNCW